MSKTTNANAVALFWDLAADLMSKHASVVEGTIINGRCLRAGRAALCADAESSGQGVPLWREPLHQSGG